MHWDRPILSDSGGFQIFSLGALRKISEEGATFQSHLDGSLHSLTPEKVMEIQTVLGTDIAMVLDECVPYPSPHEYVKTSISLTTRWAKRCLEAKTGDRTCPLRHCSGWHLPDLREESAEALLEMNFQGYAIGGLSVGEPKESMLEVLNWTTPLLPENSPRYLMGVGTPGDILKPSCSGLIFLTVSSQRGTPETGPSSRARARYR